MEWFSRQKLLESCAHYADKFYGVPEDVAAARLQEQAEKARAYFERQKKSGVKVTIEEING